VEELTPFQSVASTCWGLSTSLQTFYGKQGAKLFQRIIYSCCYKERWEPYLPMYENTAHIKQILELCADLRNNAKKTVALRGMLCVVPRPAPSVSGFMNRSPACASWWSWNERMWG
jgi:hypothetical protein